MDAQTLADVLTTAFAAGAPVVLQILAERHKGRIECRVVEVLPSGEAVLEIGGREYRYRLVEEITDAEQVAA